MNFLDAFDVYGFLVRDSLVLVLLGLSLHMMLNAGLFALPQVGMMAIGAYCAAMLSTHAGLPVPVTLLAAGVGGAVGGAVLGLALMRLDGIYLAIATLGFAEMVRVTIRNIDSLGGAVGVIGINRSINDVEVVGIVVLAMLCLVRVGRTRHGGAMRAIRQDKLMAAHQGVNVRRYRLVLFIASGTLAGLAGGIQVHLTGFVQPEVFDFNLLVSALVITIVGGSNFIAGPAVGAIIVVGLGEVFRTLQEYQHFVNAVLILVVLAFLPAGVASIFPGVWRRLKPYLPGQPESSARPGPLELMPVDGGATRKPSTGGGAEVLRVKGLSKRFGGVQAIKNVGVTLYAGEAVGVIGPNGSGKTTLLNLLSGVYAPDTGTGVVEGHPLETRWGRPDQLARVGIARTFQAIRLIDDWTVRENVALGAYLRGRQPGAGEQHSKPLDVDELIDRAMARVGITQLGAVSSGALPYGVRRKVEIARALVHRPHVLLLDEPTAGMSPEERNEIFELVGRIRDEGVTVVVVEHDVESIVRYSDRVVALSFGEVLAVGLPADVIAKEAVIDAYVGHGTRS